jgi:hypothetical protein
MNFKLAPETLFFVGIILRSNKVTLSLWWKKEVSSQRIVVSNYYRKS